jgi:integrase
LRSQLDELLARATHEVRPDEAPLLCESVAAALRRLLELVPADRRDPLALALSRSLVEQQRRKLALADAWPAWLASANRSTAPKESTLRGYAATWRRFADWAARRDLRSFHELDESAVLAYADDLWASHLTPRTFNAHVQFLRSLWGTLRVAAGLGTDNPWAGVKAKAATPDTGRRDLSPAELRAVIGAATGSLRLLLFAGALTGARLGDIANMKWADLDLAAATWSFTPMKTSRTGKRLVLPLLSPLLDELRAAKAEALSPHVFPAERELWQRADLTKVISRHFEACGLVTNEAALAGQARRKARVLVGFHSLRHTAATLAAKSGANLALVQKTLGHSTAGMIAHYTHGDTESARQVLAPLAEIMTLPRRKAEEVAA